MKRWVLAITIYVALITTALIASGQYVWQSPPFPPTQSILMTSTVAGLPAPNPYSPGAQAIVTDNIRGVWIDTGFAWVSMSGEANVKDFGARCNGTTDDSAALNLAFADAAGGQAAIKTGVCLANSANLLLGSNTQLIISNGATMKLDGRRLMAVGAGITNITITGSGLIWAINLNIADAFPTNWGWLGIVNFGGTFAAPGSHFRMNGVSVIGPWTGTPGSATASSKKGGVVIENANDVQVWNCDISGIQDEALMANGGVITSVSNALNNGAGLIRLTVTSTTGLTTTNRLLVRDIGGTVEANGEWIGTVIDATHVDLVGSAFTNAYTSGGTVGNLMRDITFGPNNYVHRFNQDGINFGSEIINARIVGNIIYDGSVGIELLAGRAEGNVIDWVLAGIGGNGGGRDVEVVRNRITNVNRVAGGTASYGISLTPVSWTPNILISGNKIRTTNNGAISVQGSGGIFAGNVNILDNEVGQWGMQDISQGIVIGQVLGGSMSGNRVTDPGPYANIGIASTGSVSGVIWGLNFVDPVGIGPAFRGAYQGLEAAGIATPIVVAGKSIGTFVTGTTNETTLRSFTHLADSLGWNGGFRIIAAGVISGVNDIKTIKLYWGSTVLATITEAAGETDAWRIEADIVFAESNVLQLTSVTAYQGATIEAIAVAGAVEDIRTNLNIRITGDLANVNDTIFQYIWIVQPILVAKGT